MMSVMPVRCALLSSFTLDALAPLVTAALRPSGVALDWYVGPYGQYAQLILDEDSELYAFAPAIVFVAVAIEDLLDGMAAPGVGENDDQLREGAERIGHFLALLRKIGLRLPTTRIFIHNLMPMQPQSHTLLASKTRSSLTRLAAQTNVALYDLAATLDNVFILDAAGAISQQGIGSSYDARYYYMARMRLSRAGLDTLTQQYTRALLAHLGLRKKCLVLDLDNTLWGGIVGEDGVEHLVLAADGLGKAFRDVQHILLTYHATGTLLAICSKNDEDLALSVIRDHPGMILCPQHFAALRINWQDKATNLREIAAELNIGLDSLVFLDDSAFDRDQVKHALPEVVVPELPRDPADYPAFVAGLPYFDTLTVTEDDKRRTAMYLEDRERKDLQREFHSLQEFLHSLKIKVEVRNADWTIVPRLAQLTQKTNQFNLTTRRYSENALLNLLTSGSWRLYAVEARDRIGDSGVVGVTLVEVDHSQNRARLDTFLLSCRALGRKIESAFLSGVLMDLRGAGVSEIEAEYIPSKRNGIARDFLANHGFVLEGDHWMRSVQDAESLCPDWIQPMVLEAVR